MTNKIVNAIKLNVTNDIYAHCIIQIKTIFSYTSIDLILMWMLETGPCSSRVGLGPISSSTAFCFRSIDA